MAETTTTPAASVVKKKATKKTSKATKKAATKKAPAKKATKKTASKPSNNGSEIKLRKPQVKLLKALAKVKAIGRKDLAAKAEVDNAGCTEWIGSLDADKRKANDAKHFPSLITLGFVTANLPEKDGAKPTFSITAEGRAEAKKH